MGKKKRQKSKEKKKGGKKKGVQFACPSPTAKCAAGHTLLERGKGRELADGFSKRSTMATI